MTLAPLVGRTREQEWLSRRMEESREGRGRFVLISGEAGVGKTRLVSSVLTGSRAGFFSAAATQDSTPPYGPVVSVLRDFLRLVPHGFVRCEPLTSHLSLLLPELGAVPPAQDDRATLFEALRCALARLADGAPASIFLDDLQWADSATLELLLPLSAWVERDRLLVVGAFRSDEIPRGHPIRRLRTGLRRAGRLLEIGLGALSPDETAALAARVLGSPPSPELAAALHDRTLGIPFFVEELAAGLEAGGRLVRGERGLALAAPGELPLPDSVRDAVYLRTEGLAPVVMRSLEVASVAGARFDLHLIEEVAGARVDLDRAVARGLVEEAGEGGGAFRHALVREAIYSGIAWHERRRLHRRVGAALEARGAGPRLVAGHWLAARDFDRARDALLAVAEEYCLVHAYRDAARAARAALEIWPDGRLEVERVALLDRLGQCAELSGDLSEAVAAWKEVADARRTAGDLPELARLEGRLATVYALRVPGTGRWSRASPRPRTSRLQA